MMKTVLRIAALFAAYATIGFGGDYAASLLARDAQNVPVQVEVQPLVEVQTAAVVDVKPAIVTRVQVRHAGSCAIEVDREFAAPLRPGAALSIDHGAGELHVEGRDGLEEVVVSARICASHEEYREQLQVRVRDGDGGIELEALYPEHRDRNGRNVARIDMTVLVPTGLTVSIDDSSGDIVASGLGDLRIDDSSGSVDVFDIVGSVSIDDSSDWIEVRDVRGDVYIDDSSGSLSVNGVGGSVTLRDSSGGIEVSDVEDSVIVESDGSGGIEVRNVGGDFTVESDGSGGIRHSGVEGRVDIPRKR